MIFDSLDKAHWYFPEPWWNEAREFILQAHQDLADGERPLRGREMFVRVLTCMTGPRENAVLESHTQYVDIQAVLDGQETIAIWPSESLSTRSPYDAERDVIFYDPPVIPAAELVLRPGFFAVFFPQDAHMPQLVSDAPCRLKKIVIKAAVELVVGPDRKPDLIRSSNR